MERGFPNVAVARLGVGLIVAGTPFLVRKAERLLIKPAILTDVKRNGESRHLQAEICLRRGAERSQYGEQACGQYNDSY